MGFFAGLTAEKYRMPGQGKGEKKPRFPGAFFVVSQSIKNETISPIAYSSKKPIAILNRIVIKPPFFIIW